MTSTTTLYLDGYQYVNGNLEFFPVAGAYVKKTENIGATKRWYDYVFNYTDHLGNIRLSYTLDYNTNKLKTLEENHYYPFGLKHRKYNNLSSDIQFKPSINNRGLTPIVKGKTYKYKYQGQERQDELGLNWDSFKWRNYDFAIGRFMSVDPLAEKYAYNSTYAFSENRVVRYNELEGLEITLNKFDKASYKNKSTVGKAGAFLYNSAISAINGAIDTFNYAGDLDRADQAAGGFGKGAGGKITGDVKAAAEGIADYAQNTTLSEFGGDLKNLATDVNTYENLAGSIIGVKGLDKLGKITKLKVPKTSNVNASMSSQIRSIAKKNNIFSGQKSVNVTKVDEYLGQIRNGSFDTASGAGGFVHEGKYILTEGNHRMNAAIKYGVETGNFSNVERLINNGNFTPGNPSDYGVNIYNLPTE